MKRLTIGLVSLAWLLAVTLSSGLASAASDWSLTINKPASPMTRSTFNISYNALSVNADSFTVKLYMDGEAPGNLIGTQNTADDPDGVNGNSGQFTVTAADGHHSFHLVATRNSDNDTKTADTNVTVDATAPAAPTYLGKTRSGNTYTIKFTAPNSSDVSVIRVYSSTSTAFTANSSTQVGVVAVSPGQTTSFTYTASSSQERFHAIRAFDAAGNGSAAVGDPNVVVTIAPTVVGAAAGGTGATGADGAAADGQVQGTSTTTPSSKDKDKSKKGSVLGTDTKQSDNSYVWPLIGAGVLLAGLLYYWLMIRAGKNPLKPIGKSE